MLMLLTTTYLAIDNTYVVDLYFFLSNNQHCWLCSFLMFAVGHTVAWSVLVWPLLLIACINICFFYSLQSSFLLFNLVSLSWYAEIMVLAFRSVGVPFLRKQILYFYIISSYRTLFRLLSVFSFVRKIDIRTSYMYTSRHKCILKFPILCYSTLLSFWIWWQWRCSFHGLQKSLPVYNVYKISCIQIGGSGEVDRKVQFLFSFVMVHSLNIYIFVPSNQISVGTCIIFVPSSAPMRTHWSCLITEVNLSPIDPLLV